MDLTAVTDVIGRTGLVKANNSVPALGTTRIVLLLYRHTRPYSCHVSWAGFQCAALPGVIINDFSRKVYIKNTFIFFPELSEPLLEKQTYDVASPFTYRLLTLLLGERCQIQSLNCGCC